MRARIISGVLVVGALVGALFALVSPAKPAAAAPGPAPLITFYVPMFEDDYMEALRSIDAGNGNRPGTVARTTISITAAASGGVIYYDQWENGYETTINDPTQTTGAGRTLVWGDNDPSNGDVSAFCPRCGGVDVIPAGGVITLNNTRLPDGTGTQAFAPGPVPTPRVQANVFWDGRDKIAASRGLTVANIGWGQADALASGAVAALDTNRWGLRYVIPIGQNSPNPNGGGANASPTEYTALSVMARFAGTNVLIDGNADGDYADAVDRNVTLGEGERVFIDGGILQGATVTASQPVQADLFAGDVDASYEVSFLELIPTNGFNTDYMAPAATYNADQATVVYLYNPSASALDITKQTSSGSTVISVPAGGTTFTVLNSPLGGAARFTAATPFLASAITGAASAANSAAFDWGYAPVPTNYLTPSLVVGWAPASQDLSDPNGSPIWVTSTQTTDVYVDFDGDPSTGAFTLPNTGVCTSSEHYDAIVNIPALSSVRISDADGDMTGARVTTCDLNVKIAAAYGEDPDNVSTGFPGLDLGTAQFPAPALLIGKASALVIDVNADGTVDPGDTVEWTATLSDLSATAMSNIVALDALPTGLTYVANSTTKSTGGPAVAVPDNVSPSTPFPLDETGLALGNLSPGGSLVMKYRTVIDNPPPANVVTIENIICATADQAAECGSGSTPLDRPAVISDRVWSDTNENGIQNGTETGGVSGVTVNLYLDADKNGVADSGTPSQTTTTDASGLYSFTVDPTPNWIVEFVAPSGQVFTQANQGADDTVDSDADRTTGRTATIDPAPGQVITHVDAGLVARATIGDKVWEDTNGNGLQDGGETSGVDGVTVNLYLDADNNGVPDGGVIATTTTAGGGLYSFPNLDPIPNYVVEFVLPGGRQLAPANQGANDNIDSDANTGTGRTPTIPLTPGQNRIDVDAGLLPPAIGIDKTSNANADGSPTVKPGDNLTYSIVVTNPGPGTLTNIAVTDTLPAGLTWNSTQVTRPATVSAGTYADTMETQGYAGSTGTLSWAGNWTEVGDAGTAPVQNTGDVRNVADGGDRSILLQKGNDAGLESIERSVGNLSSYTSVTFAYDWRCNSLEDGDDVLVEVDPDGTGTWQTVRTLDGVTGTCNNAAYTSDSITLSGSQLGTATKIRFAQSGTWGGASADEFWFDNVVLTPNTRSTSTVAGAAPSNLVTLTDLLPGESATVVVSTTVDNPLSTAITAFANTACADPTQTTAICDAVTDPVAPGVISDFVWNDYDHDGIQDVGEPGIDGVLVGLFDSTGTNLLQSTVTAGGGLYSFTVPAGTYRVQVIPPANTALTSADQGGNDNVDSDPDVGTFFTAAVSVAAGQTRTDVDAGLVGTGVIGDTIYWDKNANGSPDAGEGLAGVDVTLVWGGPDGNLATAGDNVTYTTTTNASGVYQFTGLLAGPYRVTVDTADLPNGLTVNSVDPDGGNDSTSQLVLPVGGSNLDQDFGYVGQGSIGDTIFLDFNGNGLPDPGEGIAGITVSLVWGGFDGNLATGGDNATFSVSTDSAGHYLFSNKPSGVYSVSVFTPQLPTGVTNTVDPDGGLDSTSQLTLPLGAANLDQDFGYAGSGSIGDTIFYDANGNGSPDPGEGLAGVDVTVVWAGPDGNLATTGDNLSVTLTTDASGVYLAEHLPAGTFSVTVATGTLPAGLTTNSVDPDGGNDSTSTLTLTTGQSNLDQDFGYVGSGSIGDTIFEDVDDNGLPGVGEGLAGIDVTLVWAGPDGNLATTGDNVTKTTTTGAGGLYLFSNLPAGTFSVTVDTADLPVTLTINSVDPDGGNDSTSTVTLAALASNLDQDFGYRRPNVPPTPGSDLIARCANTGGGVTVLTNDLDGDGDPVTVSSVSPTSAAGGTVTLVAGVVSYTPPSGFAGTDVFTYTVTDGYGAFATTTVTALIDVNCLIGNDRMFYFGLGGTSGPGPNPGQYSQLVSTTPVRLVAQQLVLRLRNGFVPQVGDTFDIWTAPSFSGAFAQIYGQVLDNGIVLDVQVLPDRVRVVAVKGFIVTSAGDAVDANPGDGVCAAADGRCTLRAASQEANALPGRQAIVALARSSMTLSIVGYDENLSATGDIDLTGDTTIIGQGGTIDAAHLDRAVHVRPGASLTMDHLRIQNGQATTGAIPGAGGLFVDGGTSVLNDVELVNNAGLYGGGLGTLGGDTTLNRGRIADNTGDIGGGAIGLGTTLFDSVVVENNRATTIAGGVGVAAFGQLSLREVYVRNNTAPTGAGVATNSPGTLTMSRTTLSGNAASNDAGGLLANGTVTIADSRITANTAPTGAGLRIVGGSTTVDRSTIDTNSATTLGGGIENNGTLTMTAVTLSGNGAADGAALAQVAGSASLISVTVTRSAAGTGAAISDTAGTPLNIFNTIIADQTAGAGCSAVAGGLVSGGYNHLGDTTCGFTATGDVQGASAQLSPLGVNGGYAVTHKPLSGSPVINTGAPSGCGAKDQRNFPRPRGGACDKGAIET